jgi:hypothetical protein
MDVVNAVITAQGENMTTSIPDENGSASAPATGGKPKATKKARVAPQGAHVAKKKGKSAKKATPAKKAPKGAKKAKPSTPPWPGVRFSSQAFSNGPDRGVLGLVVPTRVESPSGNLAASRVIALAIAGRTPSDPD